MHVLVIGAGPAGLFCAERLAVLGATVTLVERMPTPGRKLVLAGRGGLNLTHTEPLDQFVRRYGNDGADVEIEKVVTAIRRFPPDALRTWAQSLGIDTFAGTSGRVFPTELRATPLLRAWLRRLQDLGVSRVRANWSGWHADGTLRFVGSDVGVLDSDSVSPRLADADAVVLALGGASWPRLGADGNWTERLNARGVDVRPFEPANSGFTVKWSPLFRDRFAGQPVKNIAITHGESTVRGEALIDVAGIEGGAIYALSRSLRTAIREHGRARVLVDLRPDVDEERLRERIAGAKNTSQTQTNRLRKLGLPPVAIGLLRESFGADLSSLATDSALASAIKAVPLDLIAPFPLARAISSSGGIALDEIDDGFRVRRLDNVWAIGEMLDWDAPTGGYLLQACFSTAAVAAQDVVERFQKT